MAQARAKRLDPLEQAQALPLSKDIVRLLQHAKENPGLYAISAGFVLLCVVAGILFRISSSAAEKKVMTDYAAAVATEDPALRAAELEVFANNPSRWSAEALYLLGETAIRAQEYAKAEEALNRLRADYPNSGYVPDAVEGLAFLSENAGELDAALSGYEEIQSKWPDTFTARRQSFNIARVKESKGDITGAIEAYQAQGTLFPESSVSAKSQAALERLKALHPDLFPEEAPPEELALEAEAVDGGDDGAAAPEGAVQAPAPEEAAQAPAAEETTPQE